MLFHLEAGPCMITLYPARQGKIIKHIKDCNRFVYLFLSSALLHSVHNTKLGAFKDVVRETSKFLAQ